MASGLSRGDSDQQVVPFNLVGHMIIVKGSIGDQNDLAMMVDTGTTRTLISDELAKKLNLKAKSKTVDAYGRKKSVKETDLKSLTLGRFRFKEVKANIGALPYSKSDRRIRIDALIGLDILKRTNLCIDYDSSLLVFGPIRHSEFRIPFYDRLPFIPVPIVIADQRLNLLLDTGAKDLILYESRVAGRLRLRRTGEKTRVVGVGGLEASLERVIIRELQLAQLAWHNLSAYVLAGPAPETGPDGILGITGLSLKKLNLDFANKTISWER